MTIGKAAQWAGVGVETVRFYERKVDVRGVVSILGYCATPRLTVFGALPYLDPGLRTGL